MDKNLVCEVTMAGVKLSYRFRHDKTQELFRPYQNICMNTDQYEIRIQDVVEVTDEIWEETLTYVDPKTPVEWVEFYGLIGLTSRILLRYGRCLFHGVAFLWREKAWILSARSGTGKTTQYKLWMKLYGDEIEPINGDKPVIEVREDGEIWVYPSPWNGKENYAGSMSGPLGGIICLEQSDHNHIERMDIRSSLIAIYQQFLYYADYREEIEQVGRLESAILESVPVWKLENTGDEDSVRMTYEELKTGGVTK